MVIAGSRSNDLESGQWLAARSLVKAGGTVVVLMGLSRLQAIAESLLAGECDPSTPAAVISRGTYLLQDCRIGTLADIAQRAAGLKSPAVIVIGEVVSRRNELQWIEIRCQTSAASGAADV